MLEAVGADPGEIFEQNMREQLILENLVQVRVIARRIHDRLPASVCLEDLISAGIVGLIAAVDRYDPNQEVKLRTYAEYKIRGAILDSLRGLDIVPRLQRKRAKLIEAAISSLEQQHQRTPSEDEISAHLRISTLEYHRWLSDVACAGIVNVADGGRDGEGTMNVLEQLAADQDGPLDVIERTQLEALLACAIEKMPQLERTILSLYYYEEMTLREITQVLDLHESRISQLKTQAVLRLRSYIQKRWSRPASTEGKGQSIS